MQLKASAACVFMCAGVVSGYYISASACSSQARRGSDNCLEQNVYSFVKCNEDRWRLGGVSQHMCVDAEG